MFYPLVSIIIPVYNGSDYLSFAIDSALSQTYRNLEVLVINDGSSDNGETERIALSYGDKIRYFHKCNGGVATALNMGILEMKGDYFSWLSHDDLYLPDKIEKQIVYLEEFKCVEAVVYSDYINVDDNNKDLYPVCMDHALLSLKPLYAIFRGALHGCTLLIPRSAFINAGIFNDLRTTQDYDLWFRLIRKYRFLHLPEILVRSRLHPNQGSRHIDATSEANELWIRMMSSLSDEEVLSLEHSSQAFYEGMVLFLAQTPYVEALNFARERLTTTLQQSVKLITKKNRRLSLIKQFQNIVFKTKLLIKALLVKLHLFDYVQKLRGRAPLYISDDVTMFGDEQIQLTGCSFSSDSDDDRVHSIFTETSKILQKIVVRM